MQPHALSVHFTGEETVAQEKEVSHPRSHSSTLVFSLQVDSSSATQSRPALFSNVGMLGGNKNPQIKAPDSPSTRSSFSRCSEESHRSVPWVPEPQPLGFLMGQRVSGVPWLLIHQTSFSQTRGLDRSFPVLTRDVGWTGPSHCGQPSGTGWWLGPQNATSSHGEVPPLPGVTGGLC